MKIENKNYSLIKGDCLQLMKQLKDESIDAIVTDPPYQYLNTKNKDCEFDKPYDEKAYVAEVKRCLKPTGFICMFGRGVAFYRQGGLLTEAGFKFKEEIVWNKRKNSSPVLPLGRRHENCFIFAKTKKGTINKCKIPFVEYVDNLPLENAIGKIKNTIRKIDNDIKKPEIFKAIMLYLEKGIKEYTIRRKQNSCIIHKNFNKNYYSISNLQTLKEGAVETDIMNIPDMIEEASLKTPHHPTEKPVRLMERLIALVTNEGDVVLDSFMGSSTTGVACLNTKRRFIGMELDDTYFETACQKSVIIKKLIVINLLH